MVTSKIILLLRKMGKPQLAGFRTFLHSPFFNNKIKLSELYELIMEYAPDFPNDKLDKHTIYNALYPGKKFNEQVYKNLSSELYSLGKKYIAVTRYLEDDAEPELVYLRALEKLNAGELYKTELRNVKKEISSHGYYETYFYDKFRLAVIERSFNYNRSDFANAIKPREESDELLKYYLINLFRQRFDYEVTGLNHKVEQKESPAMKLARQLMETGLMQEIVDELAQSGSENHEIVEMYYYILMSLKYSDNDDFFEKAKKLVFKNIEKFELNDRFSLTGAIYGLSSFRLMLRGDNSDYRNTFDIINFRLKNKLYKDDSKGYITALSFRAMFMTGAYLRETEWLKKFLKKYIKEVNPEHRDNLNNLLTAYTKFYDKKFDESLGYLSLCKYELPQYKLDVRRIQLLNYYELGLTEQALSLISSFREFLSSNKELTDDEKQKHSALLSHTAKLIKLQDTYNENDITMLENKIGKEKQLLHNWWFKEKIDELKRM